MLLLNILVCILINYPIKERINGPQSFVIVIDYLSRNNYSLILLKLEYLHNIDFLIVAADFRVHEFFKTPYFKTGIYPIPGAQKALHKLSRFCKLSVVTYVFLAFHVIMHRETNIGNN